MPREEGGVPSRLWGVSKLGKVRRNRCFRLFAGRAPRSRGSAAGRCGNGRGQRLSTGRQTRGSSVITCGAAQVSSQHRHASVRLPTWSAPSGRSIGLSRDDVMRSETTQEPT